MFAQVRSIRRECTRTQVCAYNRCMDVYVCMYVCMYVRVHVEYMIGWTTASSDAHSFTSGDSQGRGKYTIVYTGYVSIVDYEWCVCECKDLAATYCLGYVDPSPEPHSGDWCELFALFVYVMGVCAHMLFYCASAAFSIIHVPHTFLSIECLHAFC